MAQKVQVLLVDDIDGGTAEETVTFSLDGVSYEIDLTTDHAAELRESFGVAAPRPQAGRLAAGRTAPPVLDGTAAPGAAGAAAEPTDPSTEREGKHR